MAKATVYNVAQPMEISVQLIITLEEVYPIASQILLLSKTQVSITNHLILWDEITPIRAITNRALIRTLLTILNHILGSTTLINLDKLDPQIITLTLLDRTIDLIVLAALAVQEVQVAQVGPHLDHPVVEEDKS